MVQIDDVDFAVAAFRQGGVWTVGELTREHLGDVETLADALGRLPGDSGAIALIGIDDDYFMLLRVTGDRVRALVSDVAAADVSELAASALEMLGIPAPLDDDEDAEAVPAGDLDLLGDLGMHAMDMAVLLDDFDLYPDEVLSDVARKVGFGKPFDDAVGLTSA
ncbi:tRNA adenosine deaminase-associated protein [Nocardioides sp. zg-DK7169]|uniref:tRNA adenosine deaminase-associated protein n=1 Tax=Nocardioides sp. zg-DK7169 TaxID=2736600 RepID=UPI0015580BC4|nr:tRNA adenosine deaminase-associated protein [Nocardioides sp. zg-DK7169]NPC98184.1 tRNA adenosine deaminase-associated protein [Nocardioides sp. zg-DK7169]